MSSNLFFEGEGVSNSDNVFVPYLKYAVFNDINRMIVLAQKYNGKVFGGYVRDVIAKILLGEEYTSLHFKDVDLWFRKQEDVDAFLKEAGTRLRFNPTASVEMTKDMYGFLRKQYFFEVNGTCLTWFDIIISEEFPVNDFDVNMLTATVTFNKKKFNWDYNPVSMDKSNTVVSLLALINKKKATMTKEYQELLVQPRFKMSRTERVKKRFLKRGWTITNFDGSKFVMPH